MGYFRLTFTDHTSQYSCTVYYKVSYIGVTSLKPTYLVLLHCIITVHLGHQNGA